MNRATKSFPTTAPLVSVVIPTYNRAALLRRAIQSVQRQTYTKLEIIVIDDASMDDTRGVVAGLGDARIRYIRHDLNKGGAAARNSGIRAATGAYIAFLDDDDEWEPEKTDIQLEALERYDVVLCTGSIRVNRGPDAIVRLDDLRRGKYTAGGTGVLMAKTPVLRETMFDESLPRYQDWDLFIRIALKHPIAYVHRPLVRYNDGDHFRITTSVLKLSAPELERQFRMLRKHREFFGPRWFRRHMSRALLYGLKHRADRWRHLGYVMRRYGPINALSAVGMRVHAIVRRKLEGIDVPASLTSKRGAA
jgi:GalNAc5-diNAcBac-PP-undecaprenol beta-1,3-glucosyltransferase